MKPPNDARAVGAPQELRALMLLSELPAGCILHPITDTRSAPHLRPGEFAIIDMQDREPQHGELFMIAYECGFSESGEVRRVVQTLSRAVRVLDERHDQVVAAFRWFAVAYDRSATVEGPYRPGGIERALVGRVVGIFAPKREEPRRLPAGKGGAA
ncbi:hypothetical protein MKK68_24185 [Methylobacterium sp. E-016]|uniref:hypothetical protein n=1 Tax=Methylobacterium sp. E-016 TaxID=2836556 RepID=UPI001FB9FB10|nr:hypothetical protein [Methylobacterium sp. E-016]MCJ2078705.1 hypothetical protein [Methylobacterium sp. E-016]